MFTHKKNALHLSLLFSGLPTLLVALSPFWPEGSSAQPEIISHGIGRVFIQRLCSAAPACQWQTPHRHGVTSKYKNVK